MTAANEKPPWGKGKCTALVAGICGVILSPLLISRPWLGLCALGLAALLFFIMLVVFGEGFVIEGGLLVVIVSILVLLFPALMKVRERPAGKQQTIQQGGGAKGSRPIRPETNSTPSAADSRR
jgi:membrane protein implicated in regulation of membrane protease activity